MKSRNGKPRDTSGLDRQGDRWVMWCVDGDGVRYTSPPMTFELAREHLDRWRRTAVNAASLHLSVDVVDRLASVAEKRNRVRPKSARRLSWEDMAKLALSVGLPELER